MFTGFPSVTIIGFGAFGQLAASLLAPHAAVSVHDRSPAALAEAAERGFATIADPRDIGAELVILAVPVRALPGCLGALAPHLRPGQLVMDVCSIKEEPARLMRQLLPAHVEILASHPMFGPGSAAGGIAGCQIVLCPVRGTRWRRLAAFLRSRLALDIVVTTPEDHDRQAAMSQGLTHLLARAFSALGERPRIRTRSFDLISEALAMVTDDAPEIFEAVTRSNRHVAPLRESLLLALSAAAQAGEDGSAAAGIRREA
ncbi:prephenate dehydrogenase/arogenate dehydrogenase family protein [Poseidonocella sp. HB161398]|uniref:prephenate dehydrogenase/arogenate dehydrogenase family protein n=1 Tax=Poseidonocella sp. HB161398 TaxID=2320855 RepID=UPI001108872C|nr:prephenate dehydrogenase/arogenate dehydrogenase family protein [Poseidonocella sp. HB161398]